MCDCWERPFRMVEWFWVKGKTVWKFVIKAKLHENRILFFTLWIKKSTLGSCLPANECANLHANYRWHSANKIIYLTPRFDRVFVFFFFGRKGVVSMARISTDLCWIFKIEANTTFLLVSGISSSWQSFENILLLFLVWTSNCLSKVWCCRLLNAWQITSVHVMSRLIEKKNAKMMGITLGGCYSVCP